MGIISSLELQQGITDSLKSQEQASLVGRIAPMPRAAHILKSQEQTLLAD